MFAGGDGKGVGVAVKLLAFGITFALLTFCFGKKAKTETNKTAIIATTVRHFAFLLKRKCFSLKKPFLGGSREASKEANKSDGRALIFLKITKVFFVIATGLCRFRWVAILFSIELYHMVSEMISEYTID